MRINKKALHKMREHPVSYYSLRAVDLFGSPVSVSASKCRRRAFRMLDLFRRAELKKSVKGGKKNGKKEVDDR